MANVQAQGLKCFAATSNLEGASNDTLVAAWNVVKARKPTIPIEPPEKHGALNSPGACTPHDLPISHWESGEGKKTSNSCLEAITGADCEFNVADVDEKMRKGEYNDLPAPLCPATNTELPMQMNLNVSPAGDGTFNIIKYYIFLKPERLDVIKEQLVTGTLMSINWAPDRSNTKKTLQYLFEKLPGITYAYWQWVLPAAAAARAVQPDVNELQQRIRKGIQHIKDEAPRGNFDCEQISWVECELVDGASPIHGFKRELISSVLKVLKDKDNFATKQAYFPVLLPDIRTEYQGIVAEILPTLLSNTLLCIGEAKFGKTPMMTAFAFAMAR